MANIVFITDSASDIDKATESKYDLKVIDFKVTVDGDTFLTRQKYSKEEFYDVVEKANSIPGTSQVPPLEFEEVYLEQIKKGYDKLIVVTINSKGSGTFNNANLAITMLFDDHPELESKVQIVVIDGVGYTGFYGQVVIDGCEMIKKGQSFDKIVNMCQKRLPRRKIYFGMYSLKFAGKSGRIPSAAAFIGEALAIKPIMKICDNQIATAKKVHGDRKIIKTIIELTDADIKKGTPYSIVYGSDPTVKDEMEKAATEYFGYPPVSLYRIGAAIAINAGPKVIGLIFDSDY